MPRSLKALWARTCCFVRDSSTIVKLPVTTPEANMSASIPSVLNEGPYVWSVVQDHITAVRPAGPNNESRPVKLPLFVTVPMASSPTSAAPAGPFPVCLLLNGFQARASYYAPLARRLASWGMVVLQYNAPALTIIPDAVELPFLGHAVEWLKAASSGSTQPALQGRADLSRLVVAGHSRGGKLAALHYSAGSVAGLPIRTAFLIDPVDNTQYTPESAAYPSAAKALRAAGRPFGMAVAGVVGASNPEGSNWRVFDAAAPNGSWLLTLKKAGHTTFMKPPTGVEAWLLDRVFGGGPLSRDVAVSQTAAAMLGWFGQQLAQPAAAAEAAPNQQQQQQPVSEGGGDILQHVTAAVHMPLASAGLQAAAAAATAAARPAAAVGDSSEGVASSSAAPQFGSALAAAFQQWVRSPVAAEQVDFKVKKQQRGTA